MFHKLKSCESIKLDATPAGQPVYTKLGFSNEYTISRMEHRYLQTEIKLNVQLTPQKIMKSDFAKVINFDSRTFGAKRSGLFNNLLNNNQNKNWLIKENNIITGFILGRMGNRFYQIGQLAALNITIAKTLILTVLKEIKDIPVVLDVVDDKQELIVWLNSNGFETRRFFTRMFLHKNLFPGEANSNYLICGPEFG